MKTLGTGEFKVTTMSGERKTADPEALAARLPPLPERAPPRRAIVLAVLRSLVSVVLLLAVYIVLPLDRSVGFSGGLLLALGLLAFVLVVTVQVRNILRARYPTVRAVEALATLLPLILVLFASCYVLIQHADGASFSEPVSKTDALYFTVTVFSTTGFGDIVARTQPARIAVTIQMVTDLLVIGLVLRLVVSAAQRGYRQRREEERLAEPGRSQSSTWGDGEQRHRTEA